MNAPFPANLRALGVAAQETADQLNAASVDAPNFDQLEKAWLLCRAAFRAEVERVFSIPADQIRELL
jgi:hypothetical protein